MTLQNSINVGKISKNSNNEILLNSNTFVDGQLTAYAKLETRVAVNGLNLMAWTESTKYSARLDLWSEDSTKEYELSIFRDTYCTNVKSGFAIYKPNQTDTLNSYLAANGNTFLAANNGNVGIGSSTPAYKLDVVGSARFNGSIGFFNKTPIAQQTGGAKTASVMYGSNEQTMLQTVYNALRNFGFLT